MPASFTVTSVVERPTLSQGGQLVNSTVIYLETLRGATGTYELPTTQFMALTGSPEGKDTLRQLLQEKADSLEAPFEM
jgi:hypothetical protein